MSVRCGRQHKRGEESKYQPAIPSDCEEELLTGKAVGLTLGRLRAADAEEDAVASPSPRPRTALQVRGGGATRR